MKTSELTGPALDWTVAKCEGIYFENFEEFEMYAGDYSTDWAYGGPIIEREGMELLCNVSPAQAKAFKSAAPDWFACLKYKRADHWHGPTPLIAAMRCYVASKLGDEVDIPAELI
jgi:hypothetical protein